mgnify:CR=1 FL=1
MNIKTMSKKKRVKRKTKDEKEIQKQHRETGKGEKALKVKRQDNGST